MANLKDILGAGELTDQKAGLYRALIAEFLGTLLLNFFGCGSVITGNVLTISISFGLSVAVLIQGIGHVSGGHINPAVTLGLMVVGKVPVVRGLLYVIVQSVGAIAGSGVLRALSPERMENSLGVVSLSPGVTPVQGFGIEFFLSFILVLTVCGACDLAKAESMGIAPLMIGLSVTVGHLLGIPRSGAGINPARTFGSAVVMSSFTDHWLYWIGPILGGMSAALIYEFVIGPAKQSKSSNPGYTVAATDEKELQGLTAKKTSPA